MAELCWYCNIAAMHCSFIFDENDYSCAATLLGAGFVAREHERPSRTNGVSWLES